MASDGAASRNTPAAAPGSPARTVAAEGPPNPGRASDGTDRAYEGLKYWQDWPGYLEADDELGMIEYRQCGVATLKDPGGHYQKVLPHFDAIGVAYEDWSTEELRTRMPIYDRTDLDGFYVAIGTSGNQFKNAGVAGHCMAELIEAVESGHDHDADPLVVEGRYTGLPIDMATFSRNREVNPNSSMSVHG